MKLQSIITILIIFVMALSCGEDHKFPTEPESATMELAKEYRPPIDDEKPIKPIKPDTTIVTPIVPNDSKLLAWCDSVAYQHNVWLKEVYEQIKDKNITRGNMSMVIAESVYDITQEFDSTATLLSVKTIIERSLSMTRNRNQLLRKTNDEEIDPFEYTPKEKHLMDLLFNTQYKNPEEVERMVNYVTKRAIHLPHAARIIFGARTMKHSKDYWQEYYYQWQKQFGKDDMRLAKSFLHKLLNVVKGDAYGAFGAMIGTAAVDVCFGPLAPEAFAIAAVGGGVGTSVGVALDQFLE